MTDLNPCPLCKKADQLESGGNYAGCKRCGLEVLIDDTAPEYAGADLAPLARERWNSLPLPRPEAGAAVAVVEELMGAVEEGLDLAKRTNSVNSQSHYLSQMALGRRILDKLRALPASPVDGEVNKTMDDSWTVDEIAVIRDQWRGECLTSSEAMARVDVLVTARTVMNRKDEG